jgi:hypothetical protein
MVFFSKPLAGWIYLLLLYLEWKTAIWVVFLFVRRRGGEERRPEGEESVDMAGA